MDRAEREALTVLCQELPGLRRECAALPERQRALLARIEANGAAREPVLDLVAELLEGTRDEVLARSRHVAGGLPGSSGGRADDEVFGCPDGACDHQAWTVPAGAPPRCALTGREMRRR